MPSGMLGCIKEETLVCVSRSRRWRQYDHSKRR